MKDFHRSTGLAITVLALCLATPSRAQENLDSGKTGAQLFASDCALCHKTPQGLKKAGGLLGLSSFLREHYTASRESADAVAKYLESLPNEPAPAAKRTGSSKRTAKGDEKIKPDEKKPGEKKSQAKSGVEKSLNPSESKSKSPETKSDAAKPAESKAEAKPEAKSDETKPAESKASEQKPDPAPAAKPDKPQKTD
jgi:mono/diheme cytochrome c family protein